MSISCTRIVVLLLPMVLMTFSVRASDTQEEAMRYFREAVTQFEDREYEAALSGFERAYFLNPSWRLLYNIGQCQAALKRYGLAVEIFERYLAEGGDSVPQVRQDEVLNELGRLRMMIGDMEVVGPEGLDVLINGIRRGITPLPGSIPVAAGVVHLVELEKDGEVLFSASRSVRGGTMIRLEFGDEKPVPPVVPDELPVDVGGSVETSSSDDSEISVDPVPPPMMPIGRKRLSPVPFFVASGVTVAFGATTIAMTAYVAASRDTVIADGDSVQVDQLNTMRRIGLMSLFGTMGAAVTAVVLLPFSDFKRERHLKASVHTPMVSVYATPQEGGVLFQGRF